MRSVSAKPAQQLRRVLVIDEDVFLAHVFKYKLEQRGFIVEVETDPAEAVGTIRQFKPTLILSELVFERIDGYDLFRKIKVATRKGRAKVYFVFLTRIRSPQEIKRGIAMGADAFLSKTENTFDDVADAIEKLVAAAFSGKG